MKNIFETIISSWGDVNMSELSEEARKRALTPPQRRVFSAINDNPGITTKQLADKTGGDGLASIIKTLRSNDLVVAERRDDDMRVLYPYWHDKVDELNTDLLEG